MLSLQQPNLVTPDSRLSHAILCCMPARPRLQFIAEFGFRLSTVDEAGLLVYHGETVDGPAPYRAYTQCSS